MPRAEIDSSTQTQPWDSLELVQTAQLTTARVISRFALGASIGVMSTRPFPVKVSLSKDIDVLASFTPLKPGVTFENHHEQITFPNAPGMARLPGVKIKLPKGNLVKEASSVIEDVKPSLTDAKTIAKLAPFAAQPKPVIHQIEYGLAARTAEGAGMGILLPVIGAVALKRFRPYQKLSNLFERASQRIPKKLLVASASTLALAGCGYSGDKMLEAMNPDGQKIDSIIAMRSPYLKDARIRGSGISHAFKKIVLRLDKGQAAWDQIDLNLIASVNQLDKKGGLTFLGDKNTETELNETGVLCNKPFTDKILPYINGRIPTDVDIDTGDRSLSGNTWAYEHNCEKNIINTFEGPSVLAVGNHDGQSTSTPTIKNINGITYLSIADPRSGPNRGDRPALSQDQLEAALGKQGSELAKKACSITDKTHIAPDIAVHTPQVAYESILRGCTNNVSTGHGIMHNDNKNTTEPIYSAYRAYNGQDVQMLINVTASGSANTTSPIDGPGRDGALVIKEYSKPGHYFSHALSIIFKKDKTVEIKQISRPKPVSPPAYMLNFVLAQSPTAAEVAQLASENSIK